MVKEFKFAITGTSKKTGEIERFVTNTKNEISELKESLKDVSIKEGIFSIRRR